MAKIALLSNITVDMIAGSLKKEFDVYVPNGFDTWQAEVVNDGSDIYKDDISAIFVILYVDSFETDETKEKRVDDWLESVRLLVDKAGRTPVFISSLDYRDRACLTYEEALASKTLHIEANWIRELNIISKLGESVYVFPMLDIVQKVGQTEFYSDKMWYVGNMPYSLVGIKEISEEIKNCFHSIMGMRKKCIALDLDGTIWGGVLGEDGWDGVILSDHKEGRLYQNVQRLLLQMKNLGVILVILSKNNPEDINELFANNEYMVLKEEDFVATAVNWKPKHQNLLVIAKKLNIGLDSFVFLDDNPSEREQMKAMCPEVEVVDFPKDTSLLPDVLYKMYEKYFKALSSTEEDRDKTEMYHNTMLRSKAKNYAESFGDYIAKLEIKVDIHLMRKNELKRVVQLMNKTNQFNTTTRRYSQEEVEDIQKNGYVITGHMRDKYGDEGLVAVMTLKSRDGVQMDESSTIEIDDFLMSCRVMGREFEKVIMTEVCTWIKVKYPNVNRLDAKYIATKKNAPVRDLYDSLGFTCMSENDHEKDYGSLLDDIRLYDGIYGEVHAFEE